MQQINETSDLLKNSMVALILDEPFYANLILNMNRIYTIDVPTIGVNVTDQVNLFINPFFWKNLSELEQIDILKHECHHVMYNHFARFKDLEPEFYEEENTLEKKLNKMLQASLLNQAADYPINEYLPNLPKEMKFYDKEGNVILQPEEIEQEDGTKIKNPEGGKPIIGKPCMVEELAKKFPKIERKQTLEYYYSFLKENLSKKTIGIQIGGTVDDHSLWKEGNQDTEFVTEKVKQIVNDAVEKTQNSKGNIPGDLLEIINRLNYKPKDWRQDLQKFIARTSEIIVETSRKIRNRRYGVLYPGFKTFPKMKLAIPVDCSGSVSNEILNQFFTEIERIHKTGVEITVIEFDTKVNGVFDFNPKREIKIHGRGGTHFAPALEKCEELEVDGIIFFTDGGDCYTDAKKPKIPILWALSEDNTCGYSWGMRTQVKLNRKF